METDQRVQDFAYITLTRQGHHPSTHILKLRIFSSSSEAMTVPFPDLDPYETLKIENKATDAEIKKAYRRLCLVHHPDKLQGKTEEEQALSRVEFEKIQFSHLILSDPKKRKRYDDTGSLEDIGDSDFDWFEYFSNTKTEINEESIAMDKKLYQGSTDEEEDIIESMVQSDGDFLYLFEAVPHTEVTEDEEKRLFKIVSKLVEDGVLETSKNWETYQKKRKTLFKKLLKSQKSEASEADELKKQIAGKRKLESEDDLKQLIQSKKKQSMDDLIARMEAKYAGGSKKKSSKSKKPKKSDYDIDDAEFEKLQKKMGLRK